MKDNQPLKLSCNCKTSIFSGRSHNMHFLRKLLNELSVHLILYQYPYVVKYACIGFLTHLTFPDFTGYYNAPPQKVPVPGTDHMEAGYYNAPGSATGRPATCERTSDSLSGNVACLGHCP